MTEEYVKKYLDALPDNQPGIALDVGACIGKYTGLLASKFQDCYAFEADLLNVSRLTENVKTIPNVVIVPKAVSDVDGHIKLFTSTHPGCHTIIENEEHLKKWGFSLDKYRLVPSITLDTFFKNKTNIKFIKCDVEGGENKLFQGARNLLTLNKITVILEAHDNTEHEKLYEFFHDLGYQIFSLDRMEQVDNIKGEIHYLLRN